MECCLETKLLGNNPLTAFSSVWRENFRHQTDLPISRYIPLPSRQSLASSYSDIQQITLTKKGASELYISIRI